MKAIFLSVLLGLGWCVAGSGTLRADEALRRVQQSLRDQGFYFGAVDGQAGDATSQAVRRYQIRNGLSVSGELDEETKRSIEKNGASVPPAASSSGGRNAPSEDAPVRPVATPARVSPSPTYQRPTVRPVPTPDEDEAPPAPVPRASGNPVRPDLRVGPGGPPQVRGGSSSAQVSNRVLPSARLSATLEGTPYEFAPPPVQADVVRKVQLNLTRQGFYDGETNGVPNALLSEALTNFQAYKRLRKTGRLDVSTLGVMRLLPGRQTLGSGDRDGDEEDGPRRRPNIIFEGRVVR